MTFPELFAKASIHRKEHACGGYPYEHADMLQVFIAALKATRVLELGTGLGYAAAMMAAASSTVHVDTIDKDPSHIESAKDSWKLLGVDQQITVLPGLAEEILPTLQEEYDLIFFDGYVPQKKFMPHFEKHVRKGGLLVIANLFLRDPNGGYVLRQLKDESKWLTAVISDTAIAYKK